MVNRIEMIDNLLSMFGCKRIRHHMGAEPIFDDENNKARFFERLKHYVTKTTVMSIF